MTTRLIYGAQESLFVGIGAAAIGAVLGLFVGMIAGYFRGIVSDIVDVLIDAIISVPALFLLVAIAFAGSHDILVIVIAIGSCSLRSIPGSPS